MRTRYRFDGERMVDKDGLPMLSHNELAHDESQICAPMVMRDIPEYQSPIDDSWITSRSWRREDLRKNDCYEVDPPKRKRGLKNERFAAKWRKPMDGDAAGPNHAVAERHNRALHDRKLRYENEPGRYSSPSHARRIDPRSTIE